MSEHTKADAGRALEGCPNRGAATGVAPPALGSAVPCPECYGGHFRPCQVCCDTGWIEYVQPSPAQVRKDLVAAGIDPDEAWRTFQRDVLKQPNTELTDAKRSVQ